MERELIELMEEIKELQQEIQLTHETIATVKQHILKGANGKTS